MGAVPSVGEHTAQILASLGIGAGGLRALEADGVVSCAAAAAAGARAGAAGGATPDPEV
jgi:hypothetical protein